MVNTTLSPSNRPVFAPITEAIDRVARQALKTCDYFLWRYLRRKNRPGTVVEFELDDFIEEYGYSQKWAIASLNRLIENKWVEMVRRLYGHGYRVIVREPVLDPPSPDPKEFSSEDKISALGKFSSTNFPSTSKKQPSNPHFSVPNNREFKEKTNTEPTHYPVPVSGIDRESSSTLQGLSQILGSEPLQNVLLEKLIPQDIEPQEIVSKAIDPEEPGINPLNLATANPRPTELPKQDHGQLLNHVKDAIAPVPLNPKIKTLVLEHSAQTVKDAIAALQERQEKGIVRNPAGYLVDAIRKGWRPNRRGNGTTSVSTPAASGDERPGNTRLEENRREEDRRRQPVNRAAPGGPTPPPLFVLQDWQRESVDQMYAAIKNNPNAISSPSAPIKDYSDMIALSQVRSQLLGWSQEKVAEVLQERYGVSSRRELRDEQLEDYAKYLESLANQAGWGLKPPDQEKPSG